MALRATYLHPIDRVIVGTELVEFEIYNDKKPRATVPLTTEQHAHLAQVPGWTVFDDETPEAMDVLRLRALRYEQQQLRKSQVPVPLPRIGIPGVNMMTRGKKVK